MTFLVVASQNAFITRTHHRLQYVVVRLCRSRPDKLKCHYQNRLGLTTKYDGLHSSCGVPIPGAGFHDMAMRVVRPISTVLAEVRGEKNKSIPTL